MGKIYEQLEYTPYGELWVEHLKTTIDAMPFRFTGKERDSETGLYYFGARYLNPQTGMWLSADPAMGEYIPQAPINDEAKQHNKKLPGMGGVFNYVNLHVYNYASNNPINLIDPNGREPEKLVLYRRQMGMYKSFPDGNELQNMQWMNAHGNLQSRINTRISMTSAYNTNYGPCVFRALLAIAETRAGKNLTRAQLNEARSRYYTNNEWQVRSQADVITLGLELLGSKEKAEWLGQVLSAEQIPGGTQATMIRREIPGDKDGNQHAAEGDARGNFLYDPLGKDTMTGKKIVQYDCYKFVPKEDEL
jgi:RHS repeat-associated protein